MKFLWYRFLLLISKNKHKTLMSQSGGILKEFDDKIDQLNHINASIEDYSLKTLARVAEIGKQLEAQGRQMKANETIINNLKKLTGR